MDISDLSEKILTGDRRALARAITLVESQRADHRAHTSGRNGNLSDLSRRFLSGEVFRTLAWHDAGIHGAGEGITWETRCPESRGWKAVLPDHGPGKTSAFQCRKVNCGCEILNHTESHNLMPHQSVW